MRESGKGNGGWYWMILLWQSTGRQCTAWVIHFIAPTCSTIILNWDKHQEGALVGVGRAITYSKLKELHLFTQTKQRLKGNITFVYKYTKREKCYLKDDVDTRTNGYKMAMNKLQQEIRRSAGISWSSPPTGAGEARNFTGYSMKVEHFMKPIMWCAVDSKSWGLNLMQEALLNPISYVSRGSWFKSSARDVLDADKSN